MTGLVHVARRFSSWVPVLLGVYWVAIFTATHWPRLEIPGGRVLLSSDKLLHFTAYMILGMLLTWSLAMLPRWRRRGILGMLSYRRGAMTLVILGMVALYGALDELTQPLAGRSTELLDWLADVAGVTTGIIVLAALDLLARTVAPGGLVPWKGTSAGRPRPANQPPALSERA